MGEMTMNDVERFQQLMNEVLNKFKSEDGGCAEGFMNYLNTVSGIFERFDSAAINKVVCSSDLRCDLLDMAKETIKTIVCMMKAVFKENNLEELTKAMTDVEHFESITTDMEKTFSLKNHDYGNSFEQSLDKFGLVAAACRMGDKRNRILTIMHSETKVKGETIYDTMKDLANYAVMTVMWVDKIDETGTSA